MLTCNPYERFEEIQFTDAHSGHKVYGGNCNVCSAGIYGNQTNATYSPAHAGLII